MLKVKGLGYIVLIFHGFMAGCTLALRLFECNTTLVVKS
jgi:hypothetical protein